MVDGNGKRVRWMGVARIPFLDFQLLHDELQREWNALPEQLRRRNRRGENRLYVGDGRGDQARCEEDILRSERMALEMRPSI